MPQIKRTARCQLKENARNVLRNVLWVTTHVQRCGKNLLTCTSYATHDPWGKNRKFIYIWERERIHRTTFHVLHYRSQYILIAPLSVTILFPPPHFPFSLGKNTKGEYSGIEIIFTVTSLRVLLLSTPRGQGLFLILLKPQQRVSHSAQ